MNDLLKYVFTSVFQRKLRSGLTILSIMIGIAAIFALVSFGQGIQKYVNDFSKEQGIDKIIIQPRGFAAPGSAKSGFSDQDIDFIKKINGVQNAVGIKIASVKVKFKDYKEKYTYLFGIPVKNDGLRLVEETAGIKIADGRELKTTDTLSVILGHLYSVPNKLFKREIVTGDKIYINDIETNVIGFYGEIGNPSDDSQIYMTDAGYTQIFGDKPYEYVYIKAGEGINVSELANTVKEKLRKHRDLREGQEDFDIQTFEDALKTFTTVINVINGILVLIALISVIVASVNIVNTMYTSIIERTQEIGVMKAVGAKNGTILTIFILESGLLSLTGGIIGVIVGFGIAKLGGYIAILYDLSLLKPAFPWWLTVGCLIFSFLIGAVAGILPARAASKLKPVDALRYE